MQSREGSYVFAGAFVISNMVLRDCHVGLRPPRNDKPSAFAVLLTACLLHQCSAGRGMPLPYNGVCDQRECLPEIATGAKRPRNDNSEAFTILTTARAYRNRSAGRGMPLPYIGVCGRRECTEICNCPWRSLPVKGTPHP